MAVTPPISVVLATFNGARYLGSQLESLTNQSLLPAELVVGDDASTDRTMELIEAFARSAPFPVHVIPRPVRLGYADNFLDAARSASGSLVAFCDQDDVWHPDKLRHVADAFGTSPNVMLVAHHAEVVDHRGCPLARVFPRDGLCGMYLPGGLPFVQYPGFTLTVRRELLEVADPTARPTEGDHQANLMGHDSWLWMLASCCGNSVILPDRLAWYRQHENLFGDQHVGMAEQIRRAASATSVTYERQAAWQAVLADYLESLAHRWALSGHPERACFARHRAARHGQVAQHLAKRALLYRAHRRREVLARWVDLARSGGYSHPGSGFGGVRSAVKDLLTKSLLPSQGRVADGESRGT